MVHLERTRSLEKREGRERLSIVRDPRIEPALASLDLDDSNIEDARRFGNKLQAAVDRWRVGREVFTAPVRLSKHDADRRLQALLRQQVTGRMANG